MIPRQIDDPIDLSNERLMMDYFVGWLQKLPMIGSNGKGFSYEKIPLIKNEATPDFRLVWNGLTVGCVECKCRKRIFPDWMIGRDKLAVMYRDWHKRGFQASIINAVKDEDGNLMFVNVARFDDLLKARDRWVVTPAEHTTTKNHGLESRDPKDHYNLPDDCFRRIK
jgi:hypothetical protein